MKLKKTLLSVLAINLMMLLPGITYATVEWFRSFGLLNSQEFAKKLQVDDAGYSYVTGVTNDDFVTMKIDPSANVI